MRPFSKIDCYQHFTGTISHYGKDIYGQAVTAIQNVEDESGHLVTDHVWVQQWVKPCNGSQAKNIGKIVSFTAKPVLYTRYDHTQDYGLGISGRTFRALLVPAVLSPKFCKRMRKHRNQYFAGVIIDHQLKFIGQGSDGKITKTIENTRYFEKISELIANTIPYLSGYALVVFKVIVYEDILFMGISR